MEPLISPDEPEPFAKTGIRFSFPLLLLVFAGICFPACDRGTATNKKMVAADTITVQQKKPAADTLVKTVVKKKIYLTFDDGPNKGTRNVMNALKEENINASLFVVGKHVFDSPEQYETWKLLQKDTSIELCNHSYTHALSNHFKKFYQHPDTVIKDFKKSQLALELRNNIARMPGRNAWRIGSIDHTDIRESSAAIDSLHKAGFNVMGWDVEWQFDHKTLSPVTDPDLLLRQIENMLEAEKTRTPGHLVLLAHDQAFQKDTDIVQLQYFLRELKKNPNYEFLVATRYPVVSKPVLTIIKKGN